MILARFIRSRQKDRGAGLDLVPGIIVHEKFAGIRQDCGSNENQQVARGIHFCPAPE